MAGGSESLLKRMLEMRHKRLHGSRDVGRPRSNSENALAKKAQRLPGLENLGQFPRTDVTSSAEIRQQCDAQAAERGSSYSLAIVHSQGALDVNDNLLVGSFAPAGNERPALTCRAAQVLNAMVRDQVLRPSRCAMQFQVSRRRNQYGLAFAQNPCDMGLRSFVAVADRKIKSLLG